MKYSYLTLKQQVSIFRKINVSINIMQYIKPASIIFQSSREDFYKMSQIDNSKLAQVFFKEENIIFLQKKIIYLI